MYLKDASDSRKTASEVQIRGVVKQRWAKSRTRPGTKLTSRRRKLPVIGGAGMGDGRDATPNLPRPRLPLYFALFCESPMAIRL